MKVFSQVSAFVKSVNIPLTKASPMSKSRPRVGGNNNVTRQQASINWGHRCHQSTRASIFSILWVLFYLLRW